MVDPTPVRGGGRAADGGAVPPGPLAGIVVLDLSRVAAGPYCTMILGDLGADVIKVEPPSGDDTRRWGPPFVGGEAAYFLALNRNKRSVVADLKTDAGRELVRRIAAKADVLVENFRSGTLERFGLPLARLRELNPRLITLTISGMGATGPGAGSPGYDFVLQATAGLMSITGPPEGPPTKVGVPVVDLTTGMIGANALLAALYARERSGRGQHIDTSLFEAQLSWLANVASGYLVSGETPRRYGNDHPNIVPYGLFEAEDRPFALGVGNDEQWRRCCEVIGRPELAEDPRYATNPARVENRDALLAALGAHFRSAPASHWIERIAGCGVPVGPVRSLPEVFGDPQVAAREMLVEVEHPSAGRLTLVGAPYKLDGTPASIRRPPPLLGEHTGEVSRDYGIGKG